MKICHLSDTHLGAGSNHPKRGLSGLTLRQEDILRSFVEAVDRIIEIRPDLCIHSGDLFDGVRPTNRLMALAGEQLHRLASQGSVETVIITGNHDAPRQPHIGAALEVYRKIENLHVVASSKLETIRIGEVVIHALPHCLTVEIQKQELENLEPDPKTRYNIFVAHGVAAGMPEFSMADIGEQELPVELMDKFDYTALGHFHNSCQVGKTAWYAGSTERLSQSERTAAKGFLEVEFDPLRVVMHEVATRPMVDIQPVNAAGKRGDELADLLRRKINEVDSSDKIVRVKVHGVSEEALRTIPVDLINDLKRNSYALNISFEREKNEQSELGVGRAAIGKIDEGFIRFLETADLAGFDREKLKREALRYLSDEG